MLVIARKLGERIQIGDSITVVVTRLKKGTVRIGVEAPRDVPIRRAELKPKDKVA